MIYIYNESSYDQWQLVKRNDFFSGIENKVNSFLRMSIKHGDMFDESYYGDIAIKNTVPKTSNEKNRGERVSLPKFSVDNTLVVFDKKSGSPLVLKANGDKNVDVIFATFDMSNGEFEGKYLRNYKLFNGNVYDFDYDVDLGITTLIFSLHNIKDSSGGVDLVWGFKDRPNIMHTRIYMRDDTYYAIQHMYESMYDIPKNGKGYYIFPTLDLSDEGTKVVSIPKTETVRPYYYIICTKPNRQESLEKILRGKFKTDDISRKANIVATANTKECREELCRLAQKERVRAVTYYIHNTVASKVEEDKEAFYEDLKRKKFAGHFPKVSVLTMDGKVTHLR